MSDTELPDMVCWLDFETTGLEPDAHVLEVSWQIRPWNVQQRRKLWAGYGVSHVMYPMPQYVREMHSKSGLIDDIAAAARLKLPSVAEAMDELHSVLQKLAEPGLAPIPLAGSGSPFDQQIIRRQWPQIDALLTYWTVDVSPMRRIALANGYDDLLLPKTDKPHRATQDVSQAQQEYKQLISILDDARKWRHYQEEGEEQW